MKPSIWAAALITAAGVVTASGPAVFAAAATGNTAKSAGHGLAVLAPARLQLTAPPFVTPLRTITYGQQVTLDEVINNVPRGDLGQPGPGRIPPPTGGRYVAFKVTDTNTGSQDAGLATFQPTTSTGAYGYTDLTLRGCAFLFPGLPWNVAPGKNYTGCVVYLVNTGVTVTGAKASIGFTDPSANGQWRIVDREYEPQPCDRANRWSGPHDTIPPACDPSGAYRRVYSTPGYFGAVATITLPAAPSNVPLTLPSLPSMRKQAGYAYLEAFVNPGPDNTAYEFGLMYHQDDNNYSLYARGPHFGPGPKDTIWTHGILINAGDTVTLSISPYPATDPNSNIPWPVGTCQSKNACMVAVAFDHSTHRTYTEGFRAAGWSASGSKVFARMTSIAQDMTPGSPGAIFNDGADFGPITWSSAQLTHLAGNSIKPTAWADDGHTQSWPDDDSRVIVTHPSGANEADEIYFHP